MPTFVSKEKLLAGGVLTGAVYAVLTTGIAAQQQASH